jgi:DNA polymerase-3 subunit alpha (Gram-positive type)
MNDYIVLDIETTGLSPEYNKITEISAIKIIGGQIDETYEQLINPETMIPKEITAITGINDEMVQNQPTISEVMVDFTNYCEDYVLIGHNIIFDYSFLKFNAMNSGLSFEKRGIDTLFIAKKYLGNLKSRSLSALCDYYQITRDQQHRAYDDALATYKLFQILEEYYKEEEYKIFEPKPLQWKPRKVEGITNRQELYLVSLLEKHGLTADFEVKALTKSEASRKIDRIIFEYGK